MNFDFNKALEAGYNEQEIYNFLKDNNEKQNLGYNFENLEKKHKDFSSIFESIKGGDKGILSESEKRAEILAKRESDNKAFEADKKAWLNEQEKGGFFENLSKNLAEDAISVLPFGADEVVTKKINETLSTNLRTQAQKDKIQKSFLQDAKEKIKKGDENLNKGERLAILERHGGASVSENIKKEKAFQKIENKEGKLSEAEIDLIEEDLGFFNTLFNDRAENVKEFKEKRKSEGVIYDEIRNAINTLKQFDEGNLLKNMVFANKDEEKEFKQNLLKDAYKIAEMQGFDDVGMDKKGEMYFIKINDKGQEEKFLINTGFFDNFFNTLKDSKFEIAGGLAGAVAGAKRGVTPLSKALHSVAGAVAGSFVGGFSDASLGDLIAGREANFKKNLEYGLQAGLLSAVGDGVLMGAPLLAKNAIKGAKLASNLIDNTALGLIKTVPKQNIQGAEKIINEVFTPEMKAEIKETQKAFGGGVSGEDLKNPVFAKLQEKFTQKYGADDKKTKSVTKLAEIFNNNSLKTKQQEMLDLIRSDKDGTTLSYLLEVAKDDVKIQANLKNMLNLASKNVEKNLKNLNINPGEIKTILDEFEDGNKQAFKEVENSISKLYDDNYKVVLDNAYYENIKDEFVKNGVNLEEFTPFLKDLGSNVFSKEGVTFTQLNNFRKNLNYYIFNKDKTPNFVNSIKKISENILKKEIDKGIDSIFKENIKAYDSIKELYTSSLKDYASMKELNESIKKLGLQDKQKTTDEVVKSLIKFTKGQGENGVNNLQIVKNYLGEENNAFLEMQILNRLFKESVEENEKAGLRVFDSENFLSKVKELTGQNTFKETQNVTQKPYNKPLFQSKEAREFLGKKKAEQIPTRLSVESFLKELEGVENKENFITHLSAKKDANARLAYLNLVKPTLDKPDLILQSGARLDYIKKFTDGKDFFTLLITEENGKRLVTFIPKTREGFLDKKINEASLIQGFASRASNKSLELANDSLTQKPYNNIKPLFESKEAREFLELVEGFHKLYKNDASIARSFTQGTAEQLRAGLATSAEGAVKQKVVKGLFDPVFRLLPDKILFGLFSKQIQGGALRYHLRKALSRSLNYDDFKLKLDKQLQKSKFNSQTLKLINEFKANLDDFNAEKQNNLQIKNAKSYKDLNLKNDESFKEFGKGETLVKNAFVNNKNLRVKINKMQKKLLRKNKAR